MSGFQDIVAIGIAGITALLLVYRSIRRWTGRTHSACMSCSECQTHSQQCTTDASADAQILRIEPRAFQVDARSKQ